MHRRRRSERVFRVHRPRTDQGRAVQRLAAAERAERVHRLSDGELERELTMTVAARTAPRQHLFDVLLAELDRRRRAA
jgi:hypothetical protein